MITVLESYWSVVIWMLTQDEGDGAAKRAVRVVLGDSKAWNSEALWF